MNGVRISSSSREKNLILLKGLAFTKNKMSKDERRTHSGCSTEEIKETIKGRRRRIGREQARATSSGLRTWRNKAPEVVANAVNDDGNGQQMTGGCNSHRFLKQ